MKIKLVACALIIYLLSLSVIAQQLSSLEAAKEFSLDSKIRLLLVLSESEPEKAQQQLTPFIQNIETFNAAERYLILRISASLALNANELTKVVGLMVRAYQLDPDIPEQQLNQPDFAKSHLMLASVYATLGAFDKAYLEKKTYLEKYKADIKEQKRKTAAMLSDKYETEHKLKTNELLLNQNKLKELQLQEAVVENKSQQLNIFLIFCIFIIFIFSFWRQLQLRKKLTLLAHTDSLTKLLNRGALFKQGQQLITDAGENNKEVSLVVLDIDYFKKINDLYGHDVGDKVLQELALLGCETMRSRDIFARLGGEEFVAVLPEASLEQAKAIAERLKEKMAVFDFNSLGISQDVTLSLGLANLKQLPGNADFEYLLQAADKAMYQAKLQGRNQVVVYG